MKPQKRFGVALGLILAAGLAIAAFILLTPAPLPAKPTMTWTPPSIEETVSPGESKTVQVSFTCSKDINDVMVRVVPELEPYLQVEPAWFSELEEGQTVTLSVTVSADQDSPLGSFDGTIQLTDVSSKSSKTFAKPLPVVVNVWNAFVAEEYGYEVKYPPNLLVNEIDQVAVFTNETADPTLEQTSISISLDANPDGLSLTDYYDGSPGYDLFSISNDQYESIQVAGITSFKFVPFITLAGEVIVVIPLEGAFIRIQDNGEAFQENGVFDNLLQTLILF